MIKEVPYEQVLEIRHKVMYPVKEKEIVILADDDQGIHIGYHKNDIPVSVVSIFLKNGELQFRKLATLEEFQCKGYASQLIRWIIDYAKDMQFGRVWCNARAGKIDFYQKFGFEPTEQTFEKDGYEFVIIEKRFPQES